MTTVLGVVMDPIRAIHYQKDSTLALLWEASSRGWTIYYFEQKDLFLRDGVPYGKARLLSVFQDPNRWFEFKKTLTMPLSDLDVILMRKDPPFNEAYIYTTYLLEYAVSLGVHVINNPRSLRDCNEKFFISSFPQCTPPTLITQSLEDLHAFLDEHREIVCKPLNDKGGNAVFYVKEKGKNTDVIFNTLTQDESCFMMAQKFIPAIKEGDKRIILINGEPILDALARIPQPGDWRGNLAVGAKGKVQPLSERDRWICAEVGPALRERGLYFVGLDVIGDYLTEINVTSPTGIRELDEAMQGNISGKLFDVIEILSS